MTWFRLGHTSVSRLRPQFASAHRWFADWEEHFLSDHEHELRRLARRFADFRRATLSVLEHGLRLVASESELASFAFFALLIALTFLI